MLNHGYFSGAWSMTDTRTYRTAAACLLAGIDNKRFNEAVAKEHYTCAPASRRGSARIFTETEVVSLFVYARLLEQGIQQRVAGHVACQVLEEVKKSPDANEVRVRKFEEKSGAEKVGEEDSFEAHIHWVFDVRGIREYIRGANLDDVGRDSA